MRRFTGMVLAVALLVSALPVWAQGGADLPAAAQLSDFSFEYQGWNNCGPATLTVGLSHFGWEPDQFTAANWLKPDTEDKNVSPWQMAEFVNSHTDGVDVQALLRQGGTLDLLRALIAHDFPVIIESGYEPEGYDWMGHYLLVMGYDTAADTFTTQDTFLGADTIYPATEIDHYWRHFNRVFIVLHTAEREAELLALLDEDADPTANAQRALDTARVEAAADSADPFAWFNLGTNFLALERYDEAAAAYDQARNVGDGLPWRMLWYQFGMFEAYLAAGRPDDVIALVQVNLATTPDSVHPIEETYYYAGLAREALNDSERAVLNLEQALIINPNFSPAREALDALQAAS